MSKFKTLLVYLFLILVILYSPSKLIASDSADLRVKEFVVMGYVGIQTDLKNEKGPYLDTLMDLLGIPGMREKELKEQLKSLSIQHANIMDFADQVVLLGGENEKSLSIEVEVPEGEGIVSGEDIENALGHLTRGEKVKIYLSNGDVLEGSVVSYQVKRIWLRGAKKRSAHLREIIAVETVK